MSQQVATLGGGCYWCQEAMFKQIRGILSVQNGFSGGHVTEPSYAQVCTGTTGHAEVVRITFDDEILSYRDVLELFMASHDPTTLNRQGEDVGTQYRSVIFYHDAAQEQIARDVVTALDAAELWPDPIVTAIEPLSNFYPAGSEHDDYFARFPEQAYCQAVISPKLAKFRSRFADRLKTSS